MTTTAPHDLRTITDEDLAAVDAWWRANNYLIIGQIYLQSNPLLRRKLSFDDIKPRLLGHWGTSPGLAFIYSHLNRLVRHTDQDIVYLAGPGHGGPALVAASYLEGTYSECFPKVTPDEEGMNRLFRQFSAPGGIPSHASVTTPGSIHEGGELGYVLVHAFGAVMDNPDLIAAAVVGDGEAETGPLEGSWKGISFLNPKRDGAVLPILHLNGGKIASPTVLSRKDPKEVTKLFEGHGYEVLWCEGSEPQEMHRKFADCLGYAYERIKSIQHSARTTEAEVTGRPKWPMIILRTPKGWTGPKTFEGKVMEGTWRSHQVPLSGVKGSEEHLRELEQWLESYRPEELFEAAGRPAALVRANNPEGAKRMSAVPASNGGGAWRHLDLPDWREYAVDVDPEHRGTIYKESTRTLGEFMRDIYAKNPSSFRVFCPDETNSNRLGAVFAASERAFMEELNDTDEGISPDGRVMEVLSAHNTHGWLEGYLLTGRHGLWSSYEAFGMVSASQTIQHAKWLEESIGLDWRVPTPSLNILLSSTCWRNDHNGFSHQGPGMLSMILNQRGDVARAYLPPDANCLATVAAHAFDTADRVNLIVQDKQPQLQWLTPQEALEHCTTGYGIWDWAGNEAEGQEPDIILACAGDVVTMETIAAAQILKEKLPKFSVRVVNIVRLMTLFRQKDHPNGMDEVAFRELFTDDRDVVFAFHGYPGAIHQMVHSRPDADRFHVRGFIEEGTTTTPFDMVVRNKISRYHLVMDALNNAKVAPQGAGALKQWCMSQLERHEWYKVNHLEDMPEVRNWTFDRPASLDEQSWDEYTASTTPAKGADSAELKAKGDEFNVD